MNSKINLSHGNYDYCLEDFFSVAKETTDAARNRAILNSVVGPETYKLISCLLLYTKPKDSTFEEIVENLKNISPSIKSSMTRYLIDNRFRSQDKSVIEYLAYLRTMIAKDCKFGDGLDEKLCDRFIGLI